MFEMTEMEIKVFNYIGETMKFYGENGYGEGYSDIMVEDIVANCELPVETIKGLLGSMTRKGIIEYMDVNQEYNVYYLSYNARQQYGLNY
jgi:hypothetical protein